MDNFSLSVVIPATDESMSLIKTVDYINVKCTEKIDKTVIILSRRATKDCVSACEQLKSKYGERVVVSVQKEDGLGSAVNYGVTLVDTTHMTFFPADMAIEFESLDRMTAEAKKNPRAVIKSSRWLEEGSFVGYDRNRMFFNRIAQWFLRLLFNTRLTDLTSPVQVIPTSYEKGVIWRENGFCTMIEHTIVPVRLGYECREVPAGCLPRTEGKSKNSWLQTALYLKTAIRVRFTPKSRFYKNDRNVN